jgi:hypothetical protein
MPVPTSSEAKAALLGAAKEAFAKAHGRACKLTDDQIWEFVDFWKGSGYSSAEEDQNVQADMLEAENG